jgi:hypothetical protein
MLMVRRDRALAVLTAIAIAWLGLVAYMTQDGFSGNQRYLIAPVALLMVLSGAGAGWLLERALEVIRQGASRPGAVRHALVALAAIGVGFAFMAPSFQRFAPTMRSLEYQADLADEVPGVIAAAGGRDTLARCGVPYTGAFLVPLVAWNLHRHTQEVRLAPRAPAVVFRVRTTRRSRPVPTLRDVGDERTLATGERWRIVAACGNPEA